MHKNIVFLLFAACFLAFPCITNANDRAAGQQFAAVALLLEQADNALEDRALDNAARLYGATVRAYQQFSKEYPTFAPDLVRFRIAYCRNQMQDIEKRLREKREKPDESPNRQSEPPSTKRMVLSSETLRILQENNLDALQKRHQELKLKGDPAAKLLEAVLHVQTGDFAAARNILENLLQNYPNDPAAHYNMAQMILRMDTPDFALAREHYRKAMEHGAPRDEDLEIVINL